jgi:hypothetical protein
MTIIVNLNQNLLSLPNSSINFKIHTSSFKHYDFKSLIIFLNGLSSSSPFSSLSRELFCFWCCVHLSRKIFQAYFSGTAQRNLLPFWNSSWMNALKSILLPLNFSILKINNCPTCKERDAFPSSPSR